MGMFQMTTKIAIFTVHRVSGIHEFPPSRDYVGVSGVSKQACEWSERAELGGGSISNERREQSEQPERCGACMCNEQCDQRNAASKHNAMEQACRMCGASE